MKNPIRKLIILTITILILLPSLALSQDKPRVLVSSFIIKYTEWDNFQEIMEKYWVPAFDKLVDDGTALSWGYLDHLWGDEWNFVIHMTVKDFASVQSAWNEGTKNFNELAPEEVQNNIFGMIQEHKDNMYVGSHFYDGTQKMEIEEKE